MLIVMAPSLELKESIKKQRDPFHAFVSCSTLTATFDDVETDPNGHDVNDVGTDANVV
jgi:hypothetical protein